MNRLTRGLKTAIFAAKYSKFYSHKVGAAVFIGSRLISIGYNQKKSHPRNQAIWSRHAEFDSLIHLMGEDSSKAILFVARLTRSNKISCAKPCPTCCELITKLGIRRVFYTNYKGQLEPLIV